MNNNKRIFAFKNQNWIDIDLLNKYSVDTYQFFFNQNPFETNFSRKRIYRRQIYRQIPQELSKAKLLASGLSGSYLVWVTTENEFRESSLVPHRHVAKSLTHWQCAQECKETLEPKVTLKHLLHNLTVPESFNSLPSEVALNRHSPGCLEEYHIYFKLSNMELYNIFNIPKAIQQL